MTKELNRCDWCSGDSLYMSYHDEEWGVPLYDNQSLFEFLILEGAQAGLSWITILRKRENYRQAFDQFDPEKIALYDEKKKHELLQNAGIVRNRLKIESVISNAQQYLALSGSFSDYVWRFVDGQPVTNKFSSIADVPATTKVSDLMSKTLKKDGFKFIGPTICYAFMQATGMVNDHLLSCHRHKKC